MTEDILVAVPEGKLYKDRAIYIATFIGGPLTAGYLIAENYKQLGERSNIWKTWVIAGISTIVILSVAYFVPATEKIPNIVYPLLYAGVTSLLVRRLQGEQIKTHAQNNGEFYTMGRAVVVSLIFCAVTVGLLVLAVTYIDVAA